MPSPSRIGRLIGSLLIGVTAAKSLAWAIEKPLIGVDHVHCHLYSVVLDAGVIPPMPAAGLVCSAGNTALYRINGYNDVALIARPSTTPSAKHTTKSRPCSVWVIPAVPFSMAWPRKVRPPPSSSPHLSGRDSLEFLVQRPETAVLYHVRGFKGRSAARKRSRQRDCAMWPPRFRRRASM